MWRPPQQFESSQTRLIRQDRTSEAKLIGQGEIKTNTSTASIPIWMPQSAQQNFDLKGIPYSVVPEAVAVDKNESGQAPRNPTFHFNASAPPFYPQKTPTDAATQPRPTPPYLEGPVTVELPNNTGGKLPTPNFVGGGKGFVPSMVGIPSGPIPRGATAPSSLFSDVARPAQPYSHSFSRAAGPAMGKIMEGVQPPLILEVKSSVRQSNNPTPVARSPAPVGDTSGTNPTSFDSPRRKPVIDVAQPPEPEEEILPVCNKSKMTWAQKARAAKSLEEEPVPELSVDQSDLNIASAGANVVEGPGGQPSTVEEPVTKPAEAVKFRKGHGKEKGRPASHRRLGSEKDEKSRAKGLINETPNATENQKAKGNSSCSSPVPVATDGKDSKKAVMRSSNNSESGEADSSNKPCRSKGKEVGDHIFSSEASKQEPKAPKKEPKAPIEEPKAPKEEPKPPKEEPKPSKEEPNPPEEESKPPTTESLSNNAQPEASVEPSAAPFEVDTFDGNRLPAESERTAPSTADTQVAVSEQPDCVAPKIDSGEENASAARKQTESQQAEVEAPNTKKTGSEVDSDSKLPSVGLPTCKLAFNRGGLSSKFASKEGRMGSKLERFQSPPRSAQASTQEVSCNLERVEPFGGSRESAEPEPVPTLAPYYEFSALESRTGRKKYALEDMLQLRQDPACLQLVDRQRLPEWILGKKRPVRPVSSASLNGSNESPYSIGEVGRFGVPTAVMGVRRGLSTDFAASEAMWSSGGLKPKNMGRDQSGGNPYGGSSNYGRSSTHGVEKEKEEWQRAPHSRPQPTQYPTTGNHPLPEIPEDSWQAQQEKQKQNTSDRSAIIMRQLRAQLNKMTPRTYNEIFQHILDIGIETTGEAQEFVNLIFEKAITNHQYLQMYAELCGQLKHILESRGIFCADKGEKEEFNFRRMLLYCCQTAFERNLENDWVPPPDVSKDDAFELLLQHKEKMKGNLMFVGCLARNDLVPGAVLMMIMRKLTNSGKSLQLEALASFLPTVFDTLDSSTKHSSSFNQVFEQVYAVSQDPSVEHRVQCLLQDCVEKFEAIQKRKIEEDKDKRQFTKHSFAPLGPKKK